MEPSPLEPVAPSADDGTLDFVSDPPFDSGIDRGHEREARIVLSYLLARESDDYIAVMDVLEASVTELAPIDVARAIADNAHPLTIEVVGDRLEQLRQWGATQATTDASRILRHSDLLARNWKYTATAVWAPSAPLLPHDADRHPGAARDSAGRAKPHRPSPRSHPRRYRRGHRRAGERRFVNHDDLDSPSSFSLRTPSPWPPGQWTAVLALRS